MTPSSLQEPPQLAEPLLRQLLNIGEGWDVVETRYCHTTRTFTVVLKAEQGWFTRRVCPYCQNTQSIPDDDGRMQVWRHLDGWTVKTNIECTLPRVQCTACKRHFQVKPSWEGTSRHFTKSFEALAFRVLKETTVRGASRVLCESDQRIWRMLYSSIEEVGGERHQAAINILHREWNRTLNSSDREVA